MSDGSLIATIPAQSNPGNAPNIPITISLTSITDSSSSTPQPFPIPPNPQPPADVSSVTPSQIFLGFPYSFTLTIVVPVTSGSVLFTYPNNPPVAFTPTNTSFTTTFTVTSPVFGVNPFSSMGLSYPVGSGPTTTIASGGSVSMTAVLLPGAPSLLPGLIALILMLLENLSCSQRKQFRKTLCCILRCKNS